MRKDSEGIDLAIILEDLGEHAESYLRSKYAPEVAEEILSIVEKRNARIHERRRGYADERASVPR